MKLAGKRILITGGGRRIGAAIAEFLSARDVEVVVHCNTAPECEVKMSHLVRMDFLTGSPEELLDRCGKLDAIINNASVFLHAGAEEQMRVNYHFPLALSEAFLRRNPSGCVVNMLDSTIKNHSSDPYKESKFLLREATLALALKAAPRGRVNAVALGPALPPDDLAYLKMAKTLHIIPLKRAVALNDICTSVTFMLENESVTGAILNVDCGMGLVL